MFIYIISNIEFALCSFNQIPLCISLNTPESELLSFLHHMFFKRECAFIAYLRNGSTLFCL